MARRRGLYSTSRRRSVVFAILVIVIGLGLASRRFDDALPVFIVSHAGDTLWTVAVFLILALFFPRWSSFRLGLSALAISVAVEFSQLWELPWLESIRSTSVGRLFFGTSFLQADLVRYSVGAVAATLIDRKWSRRKRGLR